MIEFMQANRLRMDSDQRMVDGLSAPPDRLRDAVALISGFTIKTSAVMVKRDLVARLALRFPVDQTTCEDYNFFWRAVVFAKEIEFTTAPDVMIRELPDSLTRVSSTVHLMKDHIKSLIEVRAWANSHRAPDAFIAGLTDHLHWQFRNFFVELIRSGNLVTLWRYASLSARQEGRWRLTSGLLSALKGIAMPSRVVDR